MSLPSGVRRTGTRLDPILEAVASRAAARGPARATGPCQGRVRFQEALGGSALAFLAECKRKAPSTGELSGEPDLGERAHAYKRGGAAALSILTEQDHFGGEPACGVDAARPFPVVLIDRIRTPLGRRVLELEPEPLEPFARSLTIT